MKSKYFIFLLGALWGALIVSIFTDRVAFIVVGFLLGVVGAAFVFGITELMEPEPHEKFDTKFPKH